jgi:hypothetical protein
MNPPAKTPQLQKETVRERTPIKETGFFTQSTGCNPYFDEKPGFWPPVRKSY